MPTNIKTTYVSADVTLPDSMRIRGIHGANQSAATLTLRIRTSSSVAGPPVLSFDVPAGTTSWLTMDDFGFRVEKGFADVATSASMTIFWD